MSTTSRQRTAKQPRRVRGAHPGDKPVPSGPNRHLIRRKAVGLFRPADADQSPGGAFGKPDHKRADSDRRIVRRNARKQLALLGVSSGK
ncbi:hypothetical protein OpiT1DRAFT_05636 [Opitutaceae bacterium TAV1]|nr:hypothetical protein OpiT1DRAFT_05636 [Opitutaceae bacterium TAV1]